MKAKFLATRIIGMTNGEIYEVKYHNGGYYSLWDDISDERILPKTWFEILDEEKIVQDTPKQIIKTNKIKHTSVTGESTLEYSIKNKYIKLKINGRFNITNLLRILLQEAEYLQNFKYTRISPYKIKREKAKEREDKNHVWSIIFIDVKDEYRTKTSEIIRANTNMSLESGEYNFFIPNLLEVAKERNLVELKDDVYIRTEKSKKEMVVEYIDNGFSRENLINKGWIVPTGYVEEN